MNNKIRTVGAGAALIIAVILAAGTLISSREPNKLRVEIELPRHFREFAEGGLRIGVGDIQGWLVTIDEEVLSQNVKVRVFAMCSETSARTNVFFSIYSVSEADGTARILWASTVPVLLKSEEPIDYQINASNQRIGLGLQRLVLVKRDRLAPSGE